MGKKKGKAEIRLGAGELELLEVLWQQGPSTISEAQSGLEREQGYTTVQTRLERLVAKKSCQEITDPSRKIQCRGVAGRCQPR